MSGGSDRIGLNSKMWADVEKKGAPSKWITLHALGLLKRNGMIYPEFD
jgi:hypothetical protein